jgi:hypothetical protein
VAQPQDNLQRHGEVTPRRVAAPGRRRAIEPSLPALGEIQGASAHAPSLGTRGTREAKEDNGMIAKWLGHGILVGVLSLALIVIPCMPATARSRSRASQPTPDSSLPTKGQVDGALVGIIAGVVVGTVVGIYLLTRKQTITGCIKSGANGMTITDENDKRIYTMAGDSVGVTPGNRMKLQGKKEKSAGAGAPPVWETEKVKRDFGICQP